MADHPLASRLDSFRKMAAEARGHAESATSAEMKDGYEHLAKSWDELIGEIETMKQSDHLASGSKSH